jgi:hypothetical protein
MSRRFKGARVTRVIASVPDALLDEVQRVIRGTGHPARDCLAEFVRLAMAEKLGRDLMIFAGPPSDAKAPRSDDLSPKTVRAVR